MVCRRRRALQPLRVIRQKYGARSVFTRNPRLHSRSTGPCPGRPVRRNAISFKVRRSPRCRSRSSQERIDNDGRINSPRIPVATKTQECAVSRVPAVMAITVKRLRIGNAIFVKAVLRNLHTSSRSASPAKLGAIRNPAPFCRRGVRSEK
jgi:hypothetical protein